MYQMHDEEIIETDEKLEDLMLPALEASAIPKFRNRPRGSGVGKSIHKAAEASTSSTVLSRSQASYQGQPVTPRISTSNATIQDVSFSSPQANLARKTMRRRSTEVDDGLVARRRILATQSATKSGFWRSRQLSGSESPESGNYATSTSSVSSSPPSGSPPESPCHETYIIPASDNVTESPPAPLVKAYEGLLAGCLLLQHRRKLPFLLRNLKKAFRVRCRKMGEMWPPNHVSISYGEEKETVLVSYRYTDPAGVQYAFQSPHFVRECPLCSLMGIFPNWSTLAKHLSWNHPEIEFKIAKSADDMKPKVIIYLDEDIRSEPNLEVGMQALSTEQSEEVTSPTRSPTPSDEDVETRTKNEKLPLSKEKTGEDDCLSFQLIDIERKGAVPSLSSQPSRLFQEFNIPPYHGPAEPVTLTGPNKTVSYRPDGPHLYDHLASLSLDNFGPLSWFILDKEEETFELTDVLDEDKVMCALWGRWIVFNRPTFISNYKAGVESFLDQYWTMIYKAAGWASWRAFLLTLVYHGFLTNREMVHLLKQYNELTRSIDGQKQRD